MTVELDIDCLWVPHDLGGHRTEPYVGMRPRIRWQRYLREDLERSRDVECIKLVYDATTRRAVATFRLVSDDAPSEWLQAGNLIELLDGYKVIAIGRIAAAHPMT